MIARDLGVAGSSRISWSTPRARVAFCGPALVFPPSLDMAWKVLVTPQTPHPACVTPSDVQAKEPDIGGPPSGEAGRIVAGSGRCNR